VIGQLRNATVPSNHVPWRDKDGIAEGSDIEDVGAALSGAAKTVLPLSNTGFETIVVSVINCLICYSSVIAIAAMAKLVTCRIRRSRKARPPAPPLKWASFRLSACGKAMSTAK